MHEHITRALYYFDIHLLYASIVGFAAWALTSILGGSATTKYWIWVATSLNFILPVGAVLDKFWSSHLSWAMERQSPGGKPDDRGIQEVNVKIIQRTRDVLMHGLFLRGYGCSCSLAPRFEELSSL